jgi:hypothetical protein
VLQLLHGFSFGATYLGSASFMAEQASRSAAGAQGLLSTVLAATMAATTLAGGWLWSAHAERTFLVMAALATAGMFAAACVLRANREPV